MNDNLTSTFSQWRVKSGNCSLLRKVKTALAPIAPRAKCPLPGGCWWSTFVLCARQVEAVWKTRYKPHYCVSCHKCRQAVRWLLWATVCSGTRLNVNWLRQKDGWKDVSESTGGTMSQAVCDESARRKRLPCGLRSHAHHTDTIFSKITLFSLPALYCRRWLEPLSSQSSLLCWDLCSSATTSVSSMHRRRYKVQVC